MGHFNAASFMQAFGPSGSVLFALLALWSIFWKGLALWHSAQRGKHWWFLALLLINTAGILEIVYLFGFVKLKPDQLFTSQVNAQKPSGSAPRA